MEIMQRSRNINGIKTVIRTYQFSNSFLYWLVDRRKKKAIDHSRITIINDVGRILVYYQDINIDISLRDVNKINESNILIRE